MKDPKEQDEQGKPATDNTAAQSNENAENNWDKNQQIDEEGNEIGPDDIK